MANTWYTNREVVVGNFEIQCGGMPFTEQVRYLTANSFHRAGEEQTIEVNCMFLLKLDPFGTQLLNRAGARYKSGTAQDAILDRDRRLHE